MLVKWRLLLPRVLLGAEDATAARPESNTHDSFTMPFSVSIHAIDLDSEMRCELAETSFLQFAAANYHRSEGGSRGRNAYDRMPFACDSTSRSFPNRV
jgi:hypothetical protein